jgi:hypothetical protein
MKEATTSMEQVNSSCPPTPSKLSASYSHNTSPSSFGSKERDPSLLTLRPGYSEKISFGIEEGLLSVTSGSEKLRALSQSQGESAWSFCSVSVIFKASAQSYVELRCLNELHDQVPSRNAKFMEFLSIDGGLIGDGFVGFIAEFTLINEVVSNLEAFIQSSSTPLSFSSSLSECGSSQYVTEDSACDDYNS